MSRKPLVGTPGDYGPKVADATFPARDDGVHIKGRFILGVLPDVRLTADREAYVSRVVVFYTATAALAPDQRAMR